MYYHRRVTRADLAATLAIDITSIKQISSKQLFIVQFDAFNTCLYSYSTKVGVLVLGVWYLTTTKYSRTTRKQLTQFSNRHKVLYTDNLDTINATALQD